jgi:hypothetical protein
MNDIFLAIALGGGLTYLAFLATKKLDVPFLPFVVVGPVLITVGLAVQTPSSPIFVGLQDGLGYQQWGYAISESWSKGESLEIRDLWPGKGFWPLLIAGFRQIAGPVFISLIVFNSMLIAFSVVLLQKATSLGFRVKPRLVFIILTLSSSPILLNGPTLLREAIFWLGTSATVAGLAYTYRNHYFTAIAFLLGGTFLILAIRPNYGVIITYLVAFAALVIWAFQRKTSRGKRAIFGLGCALVLALSFPPVFSYLSVDIGTIGETAERVSRGLVKGDVTTAVTPVGERFLDSTLGAAIVRFPYFVFGPFWWEVGPEPIWIAVIASTLHYWFLLATSLLLLIKHSNRNLLSVTLFFVSMIISASLSGVLTNYGILIRFRAVAELFLVPLSAGYVTSLTETSKPKNFKDKVI